MRKLKAMLYAWISQKYMHGCSNYNSLEVRKGCRSKAQGRAIFAKHDVPHAKGQVFFWPWTAVRFAKEHGFPLVIKPNVSGYSRGSYFPIHNFSELAAAIFWAKMWWPTTVVEQYLKGSNYRALTTPDKFVSVLRRYPPFVTGNGKDCIATLIETENSIRQAMNLYPTIHPIAMNAEARKHLAKQGLTLDSIPADKQYIEVFHRVALAPGGAIEVIDPSTIPAQNLQLATSVVKMFGANILGIDIIFEQGIEIPWTQQKCILLEVNSRPYIEMHHYPRFGQAINFSAALAQLDEIEQLDKDIF